MMNKSRMFFIVICFMFMLPSLSHAGAVITYHGRILNTHKEPVESNNVVFLIRIHSPNPEKCLLYEETRSINMTDSQGVFVIPIGDGVGSRTAADPGLQIEKVFENNPNITLNKVNTPKLFCHGGSSFTPGLLSQRHLEVIFDDGSGLGEQRLPLMDINFVPLAVSAYDAQHVGGSPANSVLRVDGGVAPALTPSKFNDLMSLINDATDLQSLVSGTNTKYERYGQINGANVPSLLNGQVLGWDGGWKAITPVVSDPSVKQFAKENLPSCGANTFLQNDGSGKLVCTPITGLSGGTVTSVTAGAGLKTADGNPITLSGTLSVNAGTDVGQVLQFSTKDTLPALDGSLLTNIKADSLSSTASISTSGDIVTTGKMTAGGDIIAGGNIQTKNDITSKRIFLYDHGGVGPDSIGLQAPNDMAALGGSSYMLTLPEKKGAVGQVLGVEDINGKLKWIDSSTGSVTDVTASSPLVSSRGATPNISMPPASISADGYLSSTDWNTFNDKQVAGNYVTALTGDVTASGPGSAAATVTRIQNRSVSTTAPVDGQVLLWDSTTWRPQYVRMQDIRNAWGGSQMIPATACTSSESMTWSTITDRFTCQTIGNLSSSAIAGFNAAVDARITLQKSQANGLATLGANSQVPVAQLGSGAANGSTVLHGDGTWSAISTEDATKLPLAGGVMSGDIDLNGNKIINVANIPFVAVAPTMSENGMSLRWNGTTWEWFMAGESGAGILSLNGQGGNAQSLAPTANATTYGFTSNANVHTFSIPSAATGGVTAGVISNTDYVNFSNKQAAGNYITELTGDVTATGAGIATATLADSVVTSAKLADNTVTTTKINDGAITTNKLGNDAVSTAKILNLSVTTDKIADSAVTASKLENSGATAGTYSKVTIDAKGRVLAGASLDVGDIPDLDWTKITTGKPTNLAGYGITDSLVQNGGGVGKITSGNDTAKPATPMTGDLFVANDTKVIYRYNGSAWDMVSSAGGSGGTVTSVTSGNAYLSVTDANSTPHLTLNVGSGANTVAAGDDARLSDSRTPSGTASGDLSGNYPNPTVSKIQNRSISATPPTDGQVLLWDNDKTTWAPQFVRMQDIRNAWGGSQMIPATACTSNESMTWSAITDRFTCQTIGNLSSSAIAGFDAAVDARITLQKSQANGLATLGANSQVPVAQLGSGTASTSTVLRGDGTWGAVPSGDLNITGSNFGVQSTNTVFAGPASGGSANPSFRSLASDDIPSLTMSKISNAGTAALKNVPVSGNAGTTEVVMGTDTRLADTRTPTDNSVTTTKLVDGNVTAIKLATDSVSTVKIVNGAVTNEKITSMDASKITGSVGAANLPVADGNTVGKESGILSGVAQAIKGVKTFLDNLFVNGSLSVTGALTAGTTTVSSLGSTGAVTAASVSTTGSVTAASVSTTGAVNADTITVVNGLKIGTGATTCSGPTNEGTLRYNNTSKTVEVCTGLAWVPVSAPMDTGVGGCPANYVPVPALPPYTTKNFCVAKYYMSKSGGIAASRPSRLPWVSISRDDASMQCRLLGPNYQLISNDQWQSVARNIETVAWNWSAGTVGTGSLNRGHSDNAPAAALIADPDDNNACAGTGDTCSGTQWHLQRRTFKLTNGEIIWDFAGNVWSWTNDDYVDLGVNPAISAAWQELSGLSQTNKDLFSSAVGTRNSAQGIGQAYGSSAGAVLRGGDWYYGANSGVFAVYLSNAPSSASTSIGFRCVFVP